MRTPRACYRVTGIILESVLEGYAKYYSTNLAEIVVRGQTENILKSRCNGGRETFGYTLDSERKFHIDSLTSPFVMEAFKKHNEGSTMKEIRDWLNENGAKNPVGSAFTYNSVEHMLMNRRYIGELKFRDVVVPDAIPPIIPLELHHSQAKAPFAGFFLFLLLPRVRGSLRARKASELAAPLARRKHEPPTCANVNSPSSSENFPSLEAFRA